MKTFALVMAIISVLLFVGVVILMVVEFQPVYIINALTFAITTYTFTTNYKTEKILEKLRT